MITEEQKLATLGLVTILIQSRKQLDQMEKTAAAFLEGIGGKVDNTTFSTIQEVADYVGEATYNYGDDPERAASELLDAVGLG